MASTYQYFCYCWQNAMVRILKNVSMDTQDLTRLCFQDGIRKGILTIQLDIPADRHCYHTMSVFISVARKPCPLTISKFERFCNLSSNMLWICLWFINVIQSLSVVQWSHMVWVNSVIIGWGISLSHFRWQQTILWTSTDYTALANILISIGAWASAKSGRISRRMCHTWPLTH